MAVDRRPGDVPRSTLIDIEQPGVREDEPLGCSTVNVAVSFRGLAEQLDRHSKARTSLAVGAHETYRDWRP